jgi:hypothetical protein
LASGAPPRIVEQEKVVSEEGRRELCPTKLRACERVLPVEFPKNESFWRAFDLYLMRMFCLWNKGLWKSVDTNQRNHVCANFSVFSFFSPATERMTDINRQVPQE